jgi:bifunctional DNA-binding transcriptional regulator/antitoxin component of YhaV-PrlF toxin-antitoxin module
MPPSWVEDHGLSVGDHVDIYRDPEGRLILQPSRKTSALAPAAQVMREEMEALGVKKEGAA